MAKYEDLKGKVAIVTGGGSGIGRAIALRLAQEGVAVVVADIDIVSGEDVASEISSSKGRAIAVQANVTRQGDVSRMMEKTVATFGELNILVNNAGVMAVSRIIDTDEATWDRVLAVNLKGAFLCCKAAATQMIKQGKGGSIIVCASVSGKRAPGKEIPVGAYVASKHAVVGLINQLALEVSEHHILANCICPGIVETPMWDMIDVEIARMSGAPVGSVKRKAIEGIPLGRVQTPEEVANVVAFLTSEDASYITATTIVAAGGTLPS